MRRVLLAVVLAGCALDENGLLGVDAAFDASPTEAGVLDGSPPDAESDAALDAALDAPMDAMGDAADAAPVDASPDVTDAGVDAPYDAGPILTITGGTYTLLGLDAGVCSTSGTTAASFTLTNDRDAAVDLVWVDYSCAEQAYGTVLGGGGNKNQGTYVTHVWRIRDDGSKAFLAGFVLDSANAFAVTVH